MVWYGMEVPYYGMISMLRFVSLGLLIFIGSTCESTRHGILFQSFQNTAFSGTPPEILLDGGFDQVPSHLQPWRSVRLQASIVTPPSWYRFGVFGDSGYVRLWIDHHLMVDTWLSDNATVQANYSVPVPFVPRNASLLQLELTIHNIIPTQVKVLINETEIPNTWLVPEISRHESHFLQQREENEKGWNTWLSTDMLSHVLLPHGLALSLTIGNVSNVGGPQCQNFTVRHGIKDLYGRYSDIEHVYVNKNESIVQVESATFGTYGLIIRLTPLKLWEGSSIPVQLAMHVPEDYQPRYCQSGKKDLSLLAMCAGLEDIHVHPVGSFVDNNTRQDSLLLQSILANNQSVFFVATSQHEPLPSDIDATMIVDRARKALLNEFGNEHTELRAGLVAAIAWNKIYTPYEGIITPILRGRQWRVAKPYAYVLFEWDTYLAAMMAAHLGDVWTSTSNIVRMTQSLWYQGFVAGFWNGQCGELDKSKPPLGTMALTFLLEYFPEQQWLVEYLLPFFVEWNEWWSQARMPISDIPLIAPGSTRSNFEHNLSIMCDHYPPPKYAASCETGLDNSPMYDSATFIDGANVLDQWDVGMTSLYARDCLDIARLSYYLANHSEMTQHFMGKARRTKHAIQTHLWNEDIGIYVNKKWTDGMWIDRDNETGVYPLAPTSFYPMLSRIPSIAQVGSMIEKFLVNSSEFAVCPEITYGIPSISRSSSKFSDNDYWRGRIWGPMNFLVYLGLREYSNDIVKQTMCQLAEQSRSTFLVEWISNRRVMENYNGETAEGCDVIARAAPFYHWGALTAMVADLQNRVDESADTKIE